MYYGYGPMMYYGGFGVVGGLVSFLFWVLVIIVIISVLRAIIGGPRRRWWHDYHDRRDSALEILKERYAKGEINKEEFEAKKKDLAS